MSNDKPVAVCLIGSRKFESLFRDVVHTETRTGKIVLLPHGSDPAELHLRRIDLADEVLVINAGGYIGETTSQQLAYASLMDKRIRFLVPPAVNLADQLRQCEEAHQEISNLRGKVQSIMRETKKDASEWQKILDGCRDKNLDLQKNLNDANYEIANLTAELVASTKRIVVLTNKLDADEKRIADLLNDRKVHLGIIDELRSNLHGKGLDG